MRALIVGLGSIGRRHLRNLRALEPDAEITVCRHRAPDGSIPEPDLDGIRVVHGIPEALRRETDVAMIATPAAFHLEAAVALAARGVHLFIEKPLAADLKGVDDLITTCHRQHRTLMVGYNLRFYEPLRKMRTALIEGQIGRLLSIRAEVGQYLPEWRPGRDYRETPTAQQGLGGGVVLELSHELDYLRWMAGEVSSVTAEIGHLSNLEIDVEDVSEALLRFECGAIGSVHLDMVRRPAARGCTAIGSEGLLTWDGCSHRLALHRARTGEWEDLHPAGEVERNAMFLEELRHFLHCVRSGTSPEVTGEDGRRALAIALAVKRASLERKHVDL